MRLVKKLILYFAALLLILSTVSFAIENNNNNKDNYKKVVKKSKIYESWESQSEEKKSESFEPTYYNIDLRKSIKRSIYNKIGNDAGDTIPNSFNLLSKISGLKVKNQRDVGVCWAFSYTSMLESTLKNKYQKNNIEYSPMHIDYKTSEIFNREIGWVGDTALAFAYCASEQGPIYESELPFDSVYDEENTENHHIKDKSEVNLNQKAKERVTDVKIFAPIYKINQNSSIRYVNETLDTEYTQEEVDLFRNLVKKHIMENGGVCAKTYYEQGNYNTQTNAYYYNGNESYNHQILIIGWDDSYSKDNFAGNNKPIHDGAYYVLNSWGESFGENGCYYISYDDVNIEQQIRGINKIEDVTEENNRKIYEYDPLGMNFALYSVDQSQNNLDTGYAVNIYNRNNTQSESEYLKEVRFYLLETEGIEIYVNGENENIDNCNLVASYTGNNALESGYHTIKLNTPVLLSGNKFAVKIKYINSEGASIPLEVNLSESGFTEQDVQKYYNTPRAVGYYTSAESNAGESFVSMDGDNWEDLYNYQIEPNKILKNTNACIKAITTSEAPAENVPVTGVQLDKSTATMNVGDTLKLNATIAPENATNKNITWTSSDPTIATVSNGTVTAVKQGTVEITATTEDRNKTAKCTVTIGQSGQVIHVEGISIDKKTATINVGGTVNLVATITPENATNKGYVWEHPIRETEIISMRKISEDEIQVTGLAEGTEEITVKTTDGDKTAKCTITVQNNGGGNSVAVTGIELDKTTATISVGDTVKVNATVKPDNATNKNVTWKSSDEKVAKVQNGTITGIGEGQALITVTTEDGNKTAGVEVVVRGERPPQEEVKVSGVSLDKKSATIKVTDTTNLIATITPENATNKNVKWKTSDENVAKVENGVVTGIGEGTAMITVITEDGNCQDSAKITVVKNSSSDDDIYKEKEVIDTKQKDDTLSPRILPNTGKGIIITIFAIIVIGLTISYIKYRKMKDVK